MDEKTLNQDAGQIPSARELAQDIMADIPAGTLNEAGDLVARPPKEVREILTKMFQPVGLEIGEGGNLAPAISPTLSLTTLAEDEVTLLNAFAAKVAGVTFDECKIIVVYGCRSCTNGRRGAAKQCRYEVWGNHVNTTCGWQCWTCAIDEIFCPSGPDGLEGEGS